MYVTRKIKMRETLEVIKVALPIDKVLEHVGVQKKDGAHFCPITPHHKAAFRATKSGTGYQCFHCGSKGTVITLLTELQKNKTLVLPDPKYFDAFLYAVAAMFEIPLPYKNLNTEVDDKTTLSDQLDFIMRDLKRPKAIPTTPTVQIQYNKALRKLKANVITPEEFTDIVADIQAPDENKIAKELVANIQTMEDLFADEEDDSDNAVFKF